MTLTSGWWNWERRRRSKRNTGRIWRESENQSQSQRRWYKTYLYPSTFPACKVHCSGGWSRHDGNDGIFWFRNFFQENLMMARNSWHIDLWAVTSNMNSNVIVLSAYFDLVTCQLHFLGKCRLCFARHLITVKSASRVIAENHHGWYGCQHTGPKASRGAASFSVPTSWSTHPSSSETGMQVC